jgi:prepilin signal peptidase PulO-like enzyme (type II secretory pathway)
VLVPWMLARWLRERRRGGAGGASLRELTRTAVPFGPFLAAGALLYLYLGPTLYALLARIVVGE